MISVAFISYILVTAFTPGPNNLMALTNAAKFGLRKGIIFSSGVFLGFLIDMSLCAFLTTALYNSIPMIEPIMKVIGALYIIFLAINVLRDKQNKQDDEESQLNASSFFTGAIMQLINVKVIIYGVTAMTTFVIPTAQSIVGIISGILFLSTVGFLGTVSWALFGSLFQNVFIKYHKQMNLIMAILLIYCATMILK